MDCKSKWTLPFMVGPGFIGFQGFLTEAGVKLEFIFYWRISQIFFVGFGVFIIIVINLLRKFCRREIFLIKIKPCLCFFLELGPAGLIETGAFVYAFDGLALSIELGVGERVEEEFENIGDVCEVHVGWSRNRGNTLTMCYFHVCSWIKQTLGLNTELLEQPNFHGPLSIYETAFLTCKGRYVELGRTSGFAIWLFFNHDMREQEEIITLYRITGFNFATERPGTGGILPEE